MEESKTIERPGALSEVVGQVDIVARLRIVMAGARLRETRAPHVLLSGPPGTGKTTLARIVAAELGSKLYTTTGPAMRRVPDLAGALLSLGGTPEHPAVFFIDEIHRLPVAVEETLYEAMEDQTVSVVAGSGGDARALSLPLDPLVIVGATTRPGDLSEPLRDRFGFAATMAPYSVEEIGQIVLREWARFGVIGSPEAAAVVAQRAKGTPRTALHLAARVLDVHAIEETDLTPASVARSLDAFGINQDGLDETDWRILTALVTTFAGRPVGLDALAQALDTDVATIQRAHEGALVRSGLMIRTVSGRMATPEAHRMVAAAGARAS